MWLLLAACALPLTFALAIVTLTAAPASAQRFTGDLSGTVTDGSGAVLPGATVTMTNEASGDRRVTVTNSDGFFSFSAVPAATILPSVCNARAETCQPPTSVVSLPSRSKVVSRVPSGR